MDYPRTRDDLIELFQNDRIINKKLSPDTITNTINALKAAGCVIGKSNFRTDYRYVLHEHPFSVNILETQVRYLQDLRMNIITFGDWQLIEAVNVLYEKISKLVKDDDLKREMKENHPFKDINKKVLYDLIRFSKVKKTVDVRYRSSKNGEESFGFIPDFIQFENEKLYIWGYSYKYQNIGYLRVDKIDSVHVIDFHDNSHILEEYYKKIPKVRYSLKGHSCYLFQEDRLQKVVRKTKNHLLIEATIYSEFNFMQCILSYGADCKIISPVEFKDKFIETVKKIRANYE